MRLRNFVLFTVVITAVLVAEGISLEYLFGDRCGNALLCGMPFPAVLSLAMLTGGLLWCFGNWLFYGRKE